MALGLWALSTLGILIGTPATRSTAVEVLERIASGDDTGPAAAAEVFPGVQPGPEPTETLGRDTEKKKLTNAVAKARKPGRQAPVPYSGSSYAATYESGSVAEIIETAALEFGIEPGYLISIAECESGSDPSAYNSAGYHGLFQYDDSTWEAYGYGSIWDPVAQARTTAELIAAGQSSRWPNCA